MKRTLDRIKELNFIILYKVLGFTLLCCLTLVLASYCQKKSVIVFIENVNHGVDSIVVRNMDTEKEFIRFEFIYKSNTYIAKIEKPKEDELKSVNFEEIELPTPTFSNERFVNFNKTKNFLKLTITNSTIPTPPPGSQEKKATVGKTTFIWYE